MSLRKGSFVRTRLDHKSVKLQIVREESCVLKGSFYSVHMFAHDSRTYLPITEPSHKFEIAMNSNHSLRALIPTKHLLAMNACDDELSES